MHPDRRHIKTKREGAVKGCFSKAAGAQELDPAPGSPAALRRRPSAGANSRAPQCAPPAAADLAGQRVCRVLQCSTPCALGSRPDKRIAGAGEALAEEAY